MTDWDKVFGQNDEGVDQNIDVREILDALRNIPDWPDPELDPETIRYLILDDAKPFGIEHSFTDEAANAVAAVNAVVNSPKTVMESPAAYENVIMALGGAAPNPDIYEAPDLAIAVRGHIQLENLLSEMQISVKFAPCISAYLNGLVREEHLLGLPASMAKFDDGDFSLDKIRLKNAREMAEVIRRHAKDFESLEGIEDPETYSALRFAEIEDYASES